MSVGEESKNRLPAKHEDGITIFLFVLEKTVCYIIRKSKVYTKGLYYYFLYCVMSSLVF